MYDLDFEAERKWINTQACMCMFACLCVPKSLHRMHPNLNCYSKSLECGTGWLILDILHTIESQHELGRSTKHSMLCSPVPNQKRATLSDFLWGFNNNKAEKEQLLWSSPPNLLTASRNRKRRITSKNKCRWKEARQFLSPAPCKPLPS